LRRKAPSGVGFENLPTLSDDKLVYKFTGVRHSQITLTASPGEGAARPQIHIDTYPKGPGGPKVQEVVSYDVFNFGYKVPMSLVFSKLDESVLIDGAMPAGVIKEKMTTSGFWKGTYNDPSVPAPDGEKDYFSLYSAMAFAYLGVGPTTMDSGYNEMLKYYPTAVGGTTLGFEVKKHRAQTVIGHGAASIGETTKNVWGNYKPLPEINFPAFLVEAEAAWKRAGGTTVSVAYGGLFKFTLLNDQLGLMPAFPTPIKDFGTNDFAKECYAKAHPFF